MANEVKALGFFRFLKSVAGLLLLTGLVGGALVVWFMLLPFGPTHEVFIDIAPGTGTAKMAAQLQAAGVVRSAYAFEAMKAVHGGTLRAGEYRFDHPAPVAEVYSRIRKGDVYTRALVIPEGYNIFDIAQAVEAAGLARRDVFLRAAQTHTELIARWSPGAPSLEGFLFPDTYLFSHHSTPLSMLSAMVKRFAQVSARLGLSDSEVARTVTMASLVEREVHLDAERPEVAGVFENRLRAGVPLQTDPAVVYASILRGTWTGVIHQSELHSDSPYNTYAHAGLPPGPICNPGVPAMQAAMHPAQTDAMYFVANANGETRFSKTLEEHLRNVAKYRAAQ